jgi:PAS domain S-box-containing protein
MMPTTKILLVDDNEPTRYALARMLSVRGYAVHEAASGSETLRLAAEKPDLIILDIHLPDASGYDVCRKLKGDPATASIPVLHLSATYADSESRAEGLEGGADGYLVYPVEPRELVANVEALLRTRRAERTAREQGELLRVTLASIGDAVIATDTHGRVTFLNPVAQAWTGWDETAAVGAALDAVLQLVHEETRQRIAIAAAGSGGSLPGDSHHLLIARGGGERPVESRATPIRDGDGAVVGIVIVLRDVTERRRIEATLREANRHKDEFLAMLAHELRNPLAPIRNAIQLLNRVGSQDVAELEARAIIERQLEHLVRLVDDLLDVSRITRGLIKLHKEPVDLATVVARAVESSRPLIDARRHRLTVNLPAEPLPVSADLVRLAQVILNLLNNAAKYTPEGGRILLTVERGEAGPNPHAEAVVRVRDTGMGIPAAMLGKVFDLFTQVESSQHRAEGGLGIGLTLVRRLTEMHGGTVAVNSGGAGAGAEFVVRLPLLESAQAPAADSAHAQARRPSVRRILVVDDNHDSADSLAMLLRLFGNDVRTAYDGRQGITIAAAYQPDLILLDLGLPGMNGIEVARQIRLSDTGRRPQIVALSGYGTEEDRRQTRQAGFDAHLIKPLDLETLQAMLENPELMQGGGS